MFKGSIPALITPMAEDGSIDFKAFEAFVDWQINEGSSGLVPVGTTGESPTLSHEEHMAMIRSTVAVAAGRVPVIAGTGSNSTREAREMTAFAGEAGADAALVVAPYYNKPNQAGLFEHFKEVHDASDLPIIIYNIPGRSIVDIQDDTLAHLFELPRIVGIKDATGDLARVASARTRIGKDFIQLSGEDATAVGFNAMGGVGCISVTANVAPALCAALQQATVDGDFVRARDLQDQLMPLHQAMFCNTSRAPAKYAVSLLGWAQPRVRLPVVPLAEAEKDQVKSAMIAAGLSLKE